jgi:hypothetical protein
MPSNGVDAAVVDRCPHCGQDIVWLMGVNGGWSLFDAVMGRTRDCCDGNRFAVDRRSRLVVDLEDFRESRWPLRCLTLHKFQCPESSKPGGRYRRRAHQEDDTDLSDLWKRLAAARANPTELTL